MRTTSFASIKRLRVFILISGVVPISFKLLFVVGAGSLLPIARRFAVLSRNRVAGKERV